MKKGRRGRVLAVAMVLALAVPVPSRAEERKDPAASADVEKGTGAICRGGACLTPQMGDQEASRVEAMPIDAHTFAVAGVPLPANVRVVAPAGSSPAQAGFSGKWLGTWDGELPHMLVVEEIRGDRGDVIYAWGDSKAWHLAAGWVSATGTFQGDALLVKLARPATVTYRMRADGRLDATYESQGGISQAVMTRVP